MTRPATYSGSMGLFIFPRVQVSPAPTTSFSFPDWGPLSLCWDLFLPSEQCLFFSLFHLFHPLGLGSQESHLLSHLLRAPAVGALVQFEAGDLGCETRCPCSQYLLNLVVMLGHVFSVDQVHLVFLPSEDPPWHLPLHS
jgi:hypothetical protein